LAKKIVTLDIDNTSVRLLELDGNRVKRWGTTALEPGMVENGNVVNPELVGARIRELMVTLGIRASSVVSSISGAFAISRVVLIPRSGNDSLQRRVRQLAEDITPIPMTELFLTWRQLATTENDVEILLLAVPRSVVNYHTATLQAAGLRAMALNLKTVAVASISTLPDIVALNVGPSSIDVALIVNGLPYVLHTVSLATDGFSGQVDAAQVVSSVTQAVEFYNSRNPQNPLAGDVPILLAGRDVMAPTYGEYIQEHTGRTVMLPEPPVDYPPHLSTAEYGVNIGLAVRRDGIEGHPNALTPMSINVLLGPQRQFNFSLLAVITVLVAILGLMGAFYLFQNLQSDKDTTAAWRVNLQQSQAELQKQRVNIARKGQLQQIITEFDEISSLRGGISADWILVDELAKDVVELNSIGFDQNGISFQLTADSLVAIETYVENLRGHERFATAGLPIETSGGGPREKVTMGIQTTFARD